MRQSLLRPLPIPSLRDARILKDLSAGFRVEFQAPQQGEWEPFWRLRGFVLLKLLARVRAYGYRNISAPVTWCLPSWSQQFPFISRRLQVAGTGQELEACTLSLSDPEQVIQPLSASVFPASVVGMRCIPATLAHYTDSAGWKIMCQELLNRWLSWFGFPILTEHTHTHTHKFLCDAPAAGPGTYFE